MTPTTEVNLSTTVGQPATDLNVTSPAPTAATNITTAATATNVCSDHPAQSSGDQGNEALSRMISKLCDKIDHLEKEVKELKRAKETRNGAVHRGCVATGTVHDNEMKETLKECKVKINGKQKTVKSHRAMSYGVEGVERLLHGCRNDETKKAKVFEGWKEVHKCLVKFMRDVKGITGLPVDVIEVNG